MRRKPELIKPSDLDLPLYFEGKLIPRERVGVIPYVRCPDSDRRYWLIATRAEDKRLCTFGGGAKSKDKLYESLLRELREEFGTDDLAIAVSRALAIDAFREHKRVRIFCQINGSKIPRAWITVFIEISRDSLHFQRNSEIFMASYIRYQKLVDKNYPRCNVSRDLLPFINDPNLLEQCYADA